MRPTGEVDSPDGVARDMPIAATRRKQRHQSSVIASVNARAGQSSPWLDVNPPAPSQPG